MILKTLGKTQVGPVVSALWGEVRVKSGRVVRTAFDKDMETVIVKLGNYDMDPMKAAIVLESEEGEPLLKVSTNTNHNLAIGEFVVAVHNARDELLAALSESGLFVDTGKKVEFGFVKDAPIWKLKNDRDIEVLKQQAQGESGTPTPYAVRCRTHGTVYLTSAEYTRQMMAPDSLWSCPRCGNNAMFDDNIFENAMEEQDE